MPRQALAQLHENHVAWFIPGLLEKRIEALIRSLPKSVRRLLVPAAETAKSVAAELEFGKGAFFEQLCQRLSRIAEHPHPTRHVSTG